VGKVLVPDAEAKMVPLRTLAAVASRKTRNRKELDLLARGIAYAAHSASAVVSYAAVIVDGAISAENLRHVIASLRGHMGELGEINAAPLPIREGSLGRRAVASGRPACRLRIASTPSACSLASDSTTNTVTA
jgi:hypothetical protein